MTNLKIGMYVRCPMDREEKFPRNYLIGQVIKVEQEFDKVTVRFFAEENLRMFCDIPFQEVFDARYLTRCNIAENEKIILNDTKQEGQIYAVLSSENKEDYKKYAILIDNNNIVVDETKIIANVDQGNFNPIYQMLRYEVNNPAWYKARTTVSESIQNINNAPYGFETLLGARTYLYNHQVDAIIRALTTQECKYMLADEVGLGKTIEACTIIKGLIMRYSDINILFIVPDSLIYQWKNELSSKFWMEVPIWGKENCSKSKMVLISQEQLSQHENFNAITYRNWDVCLVDETHRLLSNKMLYNNVLEISKTTKHVLLLSATPITKMRNEYHKLLTLLNPERYGTMTPEAFDELIGKQKLITNYVYELMSDLSDYEQYDLYEDFMDTLLGISSMINDEKFNEILKSINHEAEDKGYNQIKLALAYLSEFYQIDQNIIRHRRKELIEQDIKRTCKHLTYEMQSSDVGYHEYNVYEKVMSYLSYMAQNTFNNENVQEYIKSLLCACFSGPDAVNDILNLKKTQSEEELSYINDIKTLCGLWKSENNRKVNLSIDSRERTLIEYLESNNSNKILIFTGYSSTVEKLESLIKERFGENAIVSFHANKSREESQEAANIFQNELECKFIVCDETGGEGRNFQIADEIIHYDLPISPFQIEQRIGRLDRIGRKSGKDVLSVVITSNNTVEVDIFNIFNEGLNVFNESLCGMEIVFQQIQEKISNALMDDVYNGLHKIIDDIKESLNIMKAEVDKERYFDSARQFDTNKMEIYNNLINFFTENDGEVMIETMIAWAKMAGFLGIHHVKKYNEDLVFSIDTDTRKSFNIQCAKNALYFPSRMDEIIKRSKFKDEIYGTFSRDTALKHENLTFFAPGNSLYDSVVDNAMRCYKGRCTAIRKANMKYNLNVFRMIFNVKFNMEKLLEKNIPLSMVNYIKQYITTSQIKVYYGIDKNELVDNIEHIECIETALSSSNLKHLGKRDNGAIQKFIQSHPVSDWRVYVQDAYKKARSKAKELSVACIKRDYAITQLENKFNSIIARKIYFNESNEFKEFNKESLEVLKDMLINPIVELDSIAYVETEEEKLES